MKERDHSLDLLRILCMLLVVFQHFFVHGYYGGGQLRAGSLNWYLINLIYPFHLVCINCFVMLSGYFQCTKPFRLKRLVSIWVQVVVYSVGLYLAVVLLRGGFSLRELGGYALPVITERYWFVTVYFLMYLVSPLLGRAIAAMSKRTHFLCCCILLGIFCAADTVAAFTGGTWADDGTSLGWFCVMYLTGAYLRLHVPTVPRHRWGFAVYAGCTIAVALSRFLAIIVTVRCFGRPSHTSLFYDFTSLLVIPASIGLFLAIRTIHVGNKAGKLISFLAPLSFGVYLIHDHPSVRPLLWRWLKPYALADSLWMLPYAAVCIVGIFSVCCGIEWVRQKLFAMLGIQKWLDRSCDRIQSKFSRN